MTLSTPPFLLLPAAEEATSNADVSGSAVASFDLLCLPGVVMSFLDDSTFTQSSGTDGSVRHLYAADAGRPVRGECLSCGTTDSSVLGDVLEWEPVQPGGCASQFKVPVRHTLTMDLGALLLLLENLMTYLAQTEEQAQALASEAE